jgi:hypothetical protein
MQGLAAVDHDNNHRAEGKFQQCFHHQHTKVQQYEDGVPLRYG